jgi:hypothetical protein
MYKNKGGYKVSVLEETKVVQAINRLENTCMLLNEVGRIDNRFSKQFSEMVSELKKFQDELSIVRQTLNIENLGKKSELKREK